MSLLAAHAAPEPLFVADVDIAPMVAPRPRAVRRGEHASIHMDKAYIRFVADLRKVLRVHHGRGTMRVPVSLVLTVRLQPPTKPPRHLTVLHQRIPNPFPVCIDRRDIDNLTKTVMDALQPNVIADDRLVVHVNARKVYHRTPGYHVTLWEVR